jgi:hypothetical protein
VPLLFCTGLPVVKGAPVPLGRATPEGKIPEAMGRPVPEGKIPEAVGRATPEGRIPEPTGRADGKVAFSRGKGGLFEPY